MNMYEDIFFDTNIIKNDNNLDNSLFSPYEAYMKGNLFKNLYKDYKNYKAARLIPNNEQAEMLLNLNQLCFTLQDIRLYLDMYPNDQEMLRLFNNMTEQEKKISMDYENKYGPLYSSTKTNPDSFSWVKYDFPWNEVSR